MLLVVVDANIVFRALVSRGFCFKVLLSMKRRGIILCSPQYLRTELRRKKERLLQFSGLKPEEVDMLLELLMERVKVVPSSQYKPFISKGKKLTADKKDVAYFALALALGCSLWSDERRFRNQSIVRVFSTDEISLPEF